MELTAAGGLEGVANVVDDGGPAVVGPDHGDDVEPRSLFEQAVGLQEVQGGERQPALLFGGDRLGGVAPPAGLDLHEHDRPVVPGDQVDLAPGRPIPPGQDPVAEAPEVLAGEPLTLVTEDPVEQGAEVLVHGRGCRGFGAGGYWTPR